MPAILDDILELELGPVGWAIAAAGGVLALSPNARRAVRRGLVRGVAACLAATEGFRQRTAEMREGWEDLVAEAQSEMRTPAEPASEPA
jgi:hypothetical protein